MKTIQLGLMVAGLMSAAFVGAHGVDGHSHDHPSTAATAAEPTAKTTGQADMVFVWDEGLTAAFPEDAKPHEPKMHGGFNEDAETGIVYTGIPGYGLCKISSDLKTWTKIGDDPRLKWNVHGIVVFKHKGEKLIALAHNNNQRVLIVDLEGNVKQEMMPPKGDEFNFDKANAYYSGKKVRFAVTDVTYLDGKLYAVTGYSPGDFVLTAHEKDGKWQWGPTAWGGKGKEPGQFNTAHGVFAMDDHIFVANRQSFQVVKFTKEGELVKILDGIPKGSLVCNVAHTGEHFIFCPLRKVTKEQKSAPIYAHSGDAIVSTIIPGELGIPVLNNIHHCWPHWVEQADGSKQLYLMVHGWNKGKYAVLKHVK